MLELHAIATKKMEGIAEFAVAMTTRERHRFLGDLKRDSPNAYTLWFDINAEMSDCTRSDDRKSIHDGIRDGCGFIRLDRDVMGVMEEWFLGQLHLFAAIALEANDITTYFSWKNIAIAYAFLLGKPEDGMHMIDNVLKNLGFDTNIPIQALVEATGQTSCKCAHTYRVCSCFI